MKTKPQMKRLPRRHFSPTRFDEESMCMVGMGLSGVGQLSVSRVLAMMTPTRSVLYGLRKDFELSRPTLAAFLGVEVSTLKAWENGKRSPSRAARRCVCFLDNLLREKKITDLMHLVTWAEIPLFAAPTFPEMDYQI